MVYIFLGEGAAVIFEDLGTVRLNKSILLKYLKNEFGGV